RFFALENAFKFKGKANPGAVIGKMLAEDPGLKKDMKSLSAEIQKIIKEVNSMAFSDIEKEFNSIKPKEKKKEKKPEKKKKELPDLPNAVKGKVVTRIPPEPSKYNHIGHALSFLINYLYSVKYSGKCLLKFEDTNPEKCTKEYADAMEDDILNYLGIKAKVIYISDDMEKMYKDAEALIKKGKAYVCLCKREEMQDFRHKGSKCCHCKTLPEENMKEWKNMLSGKYKQGQAVLRLKGDMDSDNQVMRDPVMFRISYTEHFRHGKKYCVWPLYDFENSVEDCRHGVTHILRSSEFGSMRNELQDYIKGLLGCKKQTVVQYGRFNIKGATTKGREIRELIKEGKVSGWDDPSLVTLKALKRRGIVRETFYELVYEAGLSANTAKNIDWSLISSINRSILDSSVDRYFFIDEPVKIKVEGAPKQKAELKLHPEHPERGMRKFSTGEEFYITKEDKTKFKSGELIRLMDCLNFETKGTKYMFHSLEHEKYRGKGKHILHWLPVSDELVKLEVRMPDNTIRKGFGETGLKNIKEGDIIQFARFGFCRLDKKEKDKLVFWFTNK
ncbi:glutamate--tRNA ligase, partial [Candidatus Woesearchaeota archaeon]|nr:glutamate--tRNA ligase [Candidatus Woesearchaeota archaeon]